MCLSMSVPSVISSSHPFHVGEKGWLACRYQQRFAQAVVNGLVNGTVVWIGFRLEEYYFL